MACTSRCDEIDWTVELVRFTQVAGPCHELVQHGGAWIPEERPSATPLRELTPQAALNAIELRLRQFYGFKKRSGGSCDSPRCRCVQTGPRQLVLTWIWEDELDMEGPSPDTPDVRIICTARLAFVAKLRMFRTPRQCMIALPGRPEMEEWPRHDRG